MTGQTPHGVPSASRHEFEQDVIRRAQADPAFREQLLADSRAAIETAYGVQLKPDVDIRVVEETPETTYLVLPAQSDELSDEQLAGVAGGFASAEAMLGGGRFYDYLKSQGLTK